MGKASVWLLIVILLTFTVTLIDALLVASLLAQIAVIGSVYLQGNAACRAVHA